MKEKKKSKYIKLYNRGHNFHVPRYMMRAFKTNEHPLSIESNGYRFLNLKRFDLSSEAYNIKTLNQQRLSDNTIDYIDTIVDYDDSLVWAAHNSFDGLYVTIDYDYITSDNILYFGAFLQDEHCTFWILKFKRDMYDHQ